MRYFLILALTCCTCIGQSLSFGVTAGGRPTDDVTFPAMPESERYVVGPMFELGLHFGFAVEVDALYHRNGYRAGDDVGGNTVIEIERANSWEFPLLLKYKLPVPKIKPFIEAGWAPRTISGTVSESGVIVNEQTGQQTPYSNSFKTNWSSSFGGLFGGGVQFGVGRLRQSPEIRFTYWTSAPIHEQFFSGQFFDSTQKQVDVLIGIGWKIR